MAQYDNGTEDSSGPPSQLAGELELERAVSQRLEEMLQPLVGPLVAIVDFNLTSMPVELEGFVYSEENSLPGLPVSVSENVRKLDGGGWNFNEIAGISIKIFVSETMSPESINQITRTIPLWINLNYNRGDQILVEQVPFVRPPQSLIQFMYSWKGIAFALIAFVVIATIISMVQRPRGGIGNATGTVSGTLEGETGITGPINATGLAQMFSTISDDRKTVVTDRDAPSVSTSTAMLTLPDTAIAVRVVKDVGGEQKALGSLAKLKEFDVPKLELILKDLDPESIAIALNLSNPGASSGYFSNIDPELRRKVLSVWRELSNLSNVRVRECAAELRKRVDNIGTSSFTTSGAKPISDMINNSPENIGKDIFEDLRGIDAQLAAEVRKNIFFLEDIVEMDAGSLRKALMSIPRDQAAVLVNSASEDVGDTLLANLSQRAASLVREEADMLSNVSPEKSSYAKQVLMNALNRASK
jgi:FliG C-terminal domain